MEPSHSAAAAILRGVGTLPAMNTEAALRTYLGTLITQAALRPVPPRVAPVTILEDLVRDLPVGALIADDHGRYVGVNPAACALTRYTKTELLRRSVWQLTPDTRQREFDVLWRAFLEHGEQAGEYRLVAKGGAIFSAAYLAHAHVSRGLHVSLFLWQPPPSASTA
jgi:PAS domain S-box-containing protein